MHESCWCARGALKDLYTEASRWRYRETGGALLGWRSDEGVVVAHVLGPGPKAKHRRSSFEPDGEWQNEQGRAIYAASGRRVAYLGDWHTHPRGDGRPSRQDRKTARSIGSDPAFRSPTPLYAIAYRPRRSSGDWSVTVYEGDGFDFRELSVIEFEIDPAFDVAGNRSD